MSLSLNLYHFTVANACQQIGNRLAALKTQPNVHCRSQTGSRKKKTFRCSRYDRPFHLFCVKISRSHANKLPGWYCNTCGPVLNPPHPPKKTTMGTPLTDPASFVTHIQSLRSVNHPIHRIPKTAHPSFASGLSKLINKAISSNSLFDWHHLVCFPLSFLSSDPRSQGVSLTSSILHCSE